MVIQNEFFHLKSFFLLPLDRSLFLGIISFDQQQNQPFAALLSAARARIPVASFMPERGQKYLYPGDSTEFETPSSICRVTATAPTARGSKWAYAQYTESSFLLASRVSASAPDEHRSSDEPNDLDLR